MPLSFRPLDEQTWPDLESLFGERGACGGCWCMYWRLKRSDYMDGRGAGNKSRMRRLIRSRAPIGIIAYDGKTPVAWCAIAPREHLVVLERSRILSPVDDRPVWSVTCLFVARPYRRRGLTPQLLRAAAEFAARNGARLIEGYPTETSKKMADAFIYTGIASAFRRAGFTEVARRSPTRPIMRLELKPSRRD